MRFAALNLLCMDMEDFRDVTAWPDRIRQDVSRSPGGDSNLFLNDCLACHAGLDGLAGAFAFYDFDATAGRITYTPNTVQPKFVKAASTFPFGFETTGDSWINYWRTGPERIRRLARPGLRLRREESRHGARADAAVLRVPSAQRVREGVLPRAEWRRPTCRRSRPSRTASRPTTAA